jgi:hypothetical protein
MAPRSHGRSPLVGAWRRQRVFQKCHASPKYTAEART